MRDHRHASGQLENEYFAVFRSIFAVGSVQKVHLAQGYFLRKGKRLWGRLRKILLWIRAQSRGEDGEGRFGKEA